MAQINKSRAIFLTIIWKGGGNSRCEWIFSSNGLAKSCLECVIREEEVENLKVTIIIQLAEEIRETTWYQHSVKRYPILLIYQQWEWYQHW